MIFIFLMNILWIININYEFYDCLAQSDTNIFLDQVALTQNWVFILIFTGRKSRAMFSKSRLRIHNLKVLQTNPDKHAAIHFVIK